MFSDGGFEANSIAHPCTAAGWQVHVLPDSVRDLAYSSLTRGLCYGFRSLASAAPYKRGMLMPLPRRRGHQPRLHMIGRILVLAGALIGVGGLTVLSTVWAYSHPFGLQAGLIEAAAGIFIAAIGELLLRRAAN